MAENVPIADPSLYDPPRGANGLLDLDLDYVLALHTGGNELTMRCNPGVPADAKIVKSDMRPLNRLHIYFSSEEFATFVEPNKIRIIQPHHDIVDDDADAGPEGSSES